MLRDTWAELRELGARRVGFRVGWELRTRTKLTEWLERRLRHGVEQLAHASSTDWAARLPYPDPVAVQARVRERIGEARLAQLLDEARAASGGRLRLFGGEARDYGSPVDWHLNPSTGERWDAQAHWSRVLRDEPRVGDVKLSWEPARFGHAYVMARAAAMFPEHGEELAQALLAQLRDFVRCNPPLLGVHWVSGQELVFRLFAWLFALRVLFQRHETRDAARELIREQALLYTSHVRAYIDYARLAVYNNHLLSDACGLYVAGILFASDAHELARWRDEGHALLVDEAERQFYEDGAYIQQSHNYHRVALHMMLAASVFARSHGARPHPTWLRALERSLDFLLAHQNPTDGCLPNYGANDGALPMVLHTCDHADFRPVLQCASVLTRGERLYDAGPWDEMAAWLLGPASLDAPLCSATRRSVAFRPTGYFVLRGRSEETFTAFRCGTLRDRFSQIDMLHVDAWWRGDNVLVDGGSYLYNGPTRWHAHFLRTESHNTLQLDGADQMLHKRRFKVVYWTRAKELAFEDHAEWALVAGEHYGYERLARGLVHRRCVLMLKDGVWIVIDRVMGSGEHDVRLHWLLGTADGALVGSQLVASFPAGKLHLGVFDGAGASLPLDVACGAEEPPRGWLSRNYSAKVPVLSVAHSARVSLPVERITVLGPGASSVRRVGDEVEVECGAARVGLRVVEGIATPTKDSRSDPSPPRSA